MKKLDISRLERLRSINLKIGLAIALCLMLAAFSWTTERPIYEDPFDDTALTAELKITRTYQEPAKELPSLPKLTLENKIIVESKAPSLVSTEIKMENPAPPEQPNLVYSNKEYVPGGLPPKPEIVNEEFTCVIVAEDMPLFGDCYDVSISRTERKKCSDAELMKFLARHLHYPTIARENGVEGMVVIRFIVEKDGSVSIPELVRDIGAGCGQEALRVVKMMPDWIPGKQRGMEVRVQYNLPVKFKLD